jgi:UDP-GlcNAc3NAcA epimerase
MSKLHLCSIVGARPNFVKLAALSPELRKVSDETIIHTGQHYDYEMSKSFFDEMGIPEPKWHLNVGSKSHGNQTGDMLCLIEDTLESDRPDAVLVYGDTNSTLAGALAASKMHIPVIHIEAGCRSFDRGMPEEINRVVIDHISDMLFCSTINGYYNLAREGVPATKCHVCGDVMVDLMGMDRNIGVAVDLSDYNLLTIHREENSTPKRLISIINGLSLTDDSFIFPCHPRIRKQIDELKLDEGRFAVVDPVNYWGMRLLEKNTNRIVTDSGGVQKEAYLLKKPCITLRDNTEWAETLGGGWNVLVGTNPDKITKAFSQEPIESKYNPTAFGSPGVCKTIANVIKEELHG